MVWPVTLDLGTLGVRWKKTENVSCLLRVVCRTHKSVILRLSLGSLNDCVSSYFLWEAEYYILSHRAQYYGLFFFAEVHIPFIYYHPIFLSCSLLHHPKNSLYLHLTILI